ncbi:MAG: hypothetical protein MUP63_04500, partial [Candidatus Nanohaloarchaeota archaeon QJJ-7]|nr:hypothetical protein [Candidatus Nanohaloarchaeota archaeon QJJ-7]
IIDENVGALFPPGDVEELKEAIDELAGNDDLLERLSLKARERAVQKYSWDNFGNRLEEVYESIYDPRKDPSP